MGVTATPYRLNGASFYPIFERLIVSETIEWFIENKHLVEYKYYSIPPKSILYKSIEDIKEFDISGDFSEKGMMKVLDNSYVRADILEAYKKHAKGKKGIVYTINKTHNTQICELYTSLGLKAIAIDSDTKQDERARAIKDFKSGKVQILCNVNIFSEGFDCPDIDFIQLARPTKSLSLFLQQVGRGLRKHDGSTHVVFLDNVGSYLRFGLPSNDRDWRFFFKGFDPNSSFDNCQPDFVEDRLHYFDSEEIKHGDEEVTLLYNSEKQKVLSDFDEVIEYPIYFKNSPYRRGNFLDRTSFSLTDIQEIFSLYYDEVESFGVTNVDVPEFLELKQISKVRIGNKYGLYNTDNQKIVLQIIYDEIYQPFGSGFAIVSKDHKYGLLNLKNYSISIDYKYDYIASLYKSLLYDYFLVEKYNKLGVANNDGREIIPLEYEDIYPTPIFINVQQDGYWLVMSYEGELIETFDDWQPIADVKEFVLVEYLSYMGFMHMLKRKLLTPLVYSNVQKVFNYFLCTLKGWGLFAGDSMEVLDGSLNVVIPPVYERIEFITDKLLKVFGWAQSGENPIHGFGIIDISNRVLIHPKYADIILENEVLFVRHNNSWHVIDWDENILASGPKRKALLKAYAEAIIIDNIKKKRPRIIKCNSHDFI